MVGSELIKRAPNAKPAARPEERVSKHETAPKAKKTARSKRHRYFFGAPALRAILAGASFNASLIN
jgi:hypothetical protein